MLAQSLYTQTAAPLTISTQGGETSDISAFYGVSNVSLIAYNSDVVGGELFNVMSTLVGDEIFLPTYGCNLPLRLFELMTGAVEQLCKQDVFFAAADWVPQTTVNMQQTVVYADASNRITGVGIAYQFAGSSWTQPVGLFNGGVSI